MRMQTLLRLLCLVWLGCAGLLSYGSGWIRPLAVSIDPWSDPSSDAWTWRVTPPDLIVDLRASKAALEGLPGERRADQQLDWVVQAALVKEGLSPEALRDATYQVHSLRDGTQDETSAFEYPLGVRARIGYMPEDDAHPIASVGRLVDQARSELGEIPVSVKIYRYRLDPAADRVIVQPAEVHEGKELYTAAWGYHDAVVDSAKELDLFLGTIDSLTYADLEHTHGDLSKKEMKYGYLFGGMR